MSYSQRKEQHKEIGFSETQQEQTIKKRATTISVVKTRGLGMRVETEKMQQSAFMLISVDSPYYSKPVMRDYCLWALENLDKFLLVIVDMPQMYNYWVRRNIPLEQTKIRAEQVGYDKKKGLEKVVRDLTTKRISIIGFNDIAQEKKYETIRRIIARYFKGNVLFEQDVLSEMRNIININKNVKTIEREKDLANFLVDEISTSLYLSEFGNFPIEIAHQDEFDVVRNIYAGKYASLAKELELKGNVDYIQTERN